MTGYPGMAIDKSRLTESDIISKFILPAIKEADWDDMIQIRQEVKLRDGKVVVRGQAAARKKVKSADIVLYHKPGLPLAVVEAKANKHEIGKGMQQALDYARLLDVPFAFASNGDGFVFHDKTNLPPWKPKSGLKTFRHRRNSGRSSATGRATPNNSCPLSPRITTTMAAASHPAITSYRPLINP